MRETELKDLVPELGELQQIAYWLAHRGWSEANGGNVSVRLTDVPDAVRALPDGPPLPLPLVFPELAGTYYLVTGTGKRMRDTMLALEPHVGLIRILPGGQSYASLWGVPRVTSEFPAHSAIHRMCLAERPGFTAIVHTHPVSLVALTHVPAFADADVLNDVLFRMQPRRASSCRSGWGWCRTRCPAPSSWDWPRRRRCERTRSSPGTSTAWSPSGAACRRPSTGSRCWKRRRPSTGRWCRAGCSPWA